MPHGVSSCVEERAACVPPAVQLDVVRVVAVVRPGQGGGVAGTGPHTDKQPARNKTQDLVEIPSEPATGIVLDLEIFSACLIVYDGVMGSRINLKFLMDCL